MTLLDLLPESRETRFWKFHQANPGVYESLERMVQRLLAKGHTKLGLRMCWEVLRWETMLNTTDPHSAYRLNNDYVPRYARLLIERHPEWSSVFSLRGHQ